MVALTIASAPARRTGSGRLAELSNCSDAETAGHADVVTSRSDGVLSIRDSGPQDFEALREFCHSWGPETRYHRLFSGRRLTEDELRRIANPVLHGNLGVIAQSRGTVLGSAEAVQLSVPRTFELGISVRDDWQSQGLGTLLLEALLGSARCAGAARLVGVCLAGNRRVLRLARHFAFDVRRHPSDADLMLLGLELAGGVAGEGCPRDA